VSSAVRGWQFEAAVAAVKGNLEPAEGHVLVVAVYRPPQVYAGAALGAGTAVVGEPSPELPKPGALSMPGAYPPRATRDGTVLIEIELTAAGVATAHRVMTPPSAFDSPALDTVRGWRFGFPTQPTGAAQLFAYALVGFREPITQ
jgi:TonB family protein